MHATSFSEPPPVRMTKSGHAIEAAAFSHKDWRLAVSTMIPAHTLQS